MQFWLTLIWVVIGVVVTLVMVRAFWRPLVDKLQSGRANSREEMSAATPGLQAAGRKVEPAKTEKENLPGGPHSRTRDLGQSLRSYAQMQKLSIGKVSLVFAEHDLAKTLGDESYRVREVLEHLEKQGHARKSAVQGCWTIS